MTRYFASYALIDGNVQRDVRLKAAGGYWAEITAGATKAADDLELPGIALPGMLNAHSHAFHRALRGRTHGDGGTFWTWRTRMYEAAARLDPDRYFALARATYAEMVAAGYTSVAEFHYVHHAPGGSPYDDPNAMGKALIAAAREAGIALTLLDVCYLHGGLDTTGYTELDPLQQRFSDGDMDSFLARHEKLVSEAGGEATIGLAAHSVRAVTPDELRRLAAAAAGGILHVHAGEQLAEVEMCQVVHGMSPIELLAETGMLHANATVVHGTHLSKTDIRLLAEAGASVAFCPTTERDLADGIGPARALLDAGAHLAIGSDQHAIIDPFAELQAIEGHERLVSHNRGNFPPGQLLQIATNPVPVGHEHAGLRVGAPADVVAIDAHSGRTAGSEPTGIVMSASAADVTDVVVGGERIVAAGQHRVGNVGAALSTAMEEIWPAH